MIEADKTKPDKQLKVDNLFSSGKSQGAAKGGPNKRKANAPTKRIPKTAQQAQREQQAEPAQHADAAAAAGRTKRSTVAAADAATAGNFASDGVARGGEQEEGQSARAARVQARADQLHPTQLGSPSDTRGKRRRGGSPSQDGYDGHEARVRLAVIDVPINVSDKAKRGGAPCQ